METGLRLLLFSQAVLISAFEIFSVFFTQDYFTIVNKVFNVKSAEL